MNLKEFFKDYFSKTETEKEEMLIVLFTEYFEHVKSNRLSKQQMMESLNGILKRSEMEEEYEVSEAIRNLIETIESIKNEKE